MRYALLIYADEKELTEALSTTEGIQQHVAMLGQWLKDEADRVAPGLPLAPTPAATTVRVRNDEVLTTDGPFAETKEQLAGFFVAECVDLDEAIELVSRLPLARVGSIEIRPVAEELAAAIYPPGEL